MSIFICVLRFHHDMRNPCAPLTLKPFAMHTYVVTVICVGSCSKDCFAISRMFCLAGALLAT